MGNMGSRTAVTEEAILVDDDTTLGNAMKRNGLDNVPILTKIRSPRPKKTIRYFTHTFTNLTKVGVVVDNCASGLAP
jgi:hypothetical protein